MAGPAVLTAREVRARRLARHGLTAALPDPTPAGAVAAMHGAQAQIASAAELSVALRVPGATRATVRDALADGSVMIRRGFWIDGYYTQSRHDEDRGWGIAMRAGY